MSAPEEGQEPQISLTPKVKPHESSQPEEAQATAPGEPEAAAADSDQGHGHRGPPPGEEPRWLDHPENVKKLIRGFWVCCAVLLVPDLLEFLGLVHFKHPHEGFVWRGYAWENFVGFFAFYGFLACVVLVLIAKQIRKVVMRAEDYYGE